LPGADEATFFASSTRDIPESLLVQAAGSYIPESTLPRNSRIRRRAFEVMEFRTRRDEPDSFEAVGERESIREFTRRSAGTQKGRECMPGDPYPTDRTWKLFK
jgi:hypothetical protein